MKLRKNYLSILKLVIIGILHLISECLSLKFLEIKIPEYMGKGESVTLECEYDLENVPLYSIKWYFNEEEFYRYVPKESPPFKAFPVKYINVDLSKSGEKKVLMRNVQLELTGDYKCEVSTDGPLFQTEIFYSHMTVIELPKQQLPIISITDVKMEYGKSIEGECYLLGTFPEVNITWYINDKKVTIHNSNNSNSMSSVIPQKDNNNNNNNNNNLNYGKSKIIIQMDKSFFKENNIMKIRCEMSIYNLWKGMSEKLIRNDIKEVLERTISQSQIYQAQNNGASRESSSINLFNITILLILLPIIIINSSILLKKIN